VPAAPNTPNTPTSPHDPYAEDGADAAEAGDGGDDDETPETLLHPSKSRRRRVRWPDQAAAAEARRKAAAEAAGEEYFPPSRPIPALTAVAHVAYDPRAAAVQAVLHVYTGDGYSGLKSRFKRTLKAKKLTDSDDEGEAGAGAGAPAAGPPGGAGASPAAGGAAGAAGAAGGAGANRAANPPGTAGIGDDDAVIAEASRGPSFQNGPGFDVFSLTSGALNSAMATVEDEPWVTDMMGRAGVKQLVFEECALLIRQYGQTATEALSAVMKYRLPEVIRAQRALGHLYLDFHPSFPYYEVVNMTRKAAVVIAVVMLASSDSYVQMGVALLLLLFILTLSYWFPPYRAVHIGPNPWEPPVVYCPAALRDLQRGKALRGMGLQSRDDTDAALMLTGVPLDSERARMLRETIETHSNVDAEDPRRVVAEAAQGGGGPATEGRSSSMWGLRDLVYVANWSRALPDLITTPRLELFSLFVIVLNTVVFAITRELQAEEYERTVDTLGDSTQAAAAAAGLSTSVVASQTAALTKTAAIETYATTSLSTFVFVINMILVVGFLVAIGADIVVEGWMATRQQEALERATEWARQRDRAFEAGQFLQMRRLIRNALLGEGTSPLGWVAFMRDSACCCCCRALGKRADPDDEDATAAADAKAAARAAAELATAQKAAAAAAAKAAKAAKAEADKKAKDKSKARAAGKGDGAAGKKAGGGACGCCKRGVAKTVDAAEGADATGAAGAGAEGAPAAAGAGGAIAAAAAGGAASHDDEAGLLGIDDEGDDASVQGGAPAAAAATRGGPAAPSAPVGVAVVHTGDEEEEDYEGEDEDEDEDEEEEEEEDDDDDEAEAGQEEEEEEEESVESDAGVDEPVSHLAGFGAAALSGRLSSASSMASRGSDGAGTSSSHSTQDRPLLVRGAPPPAATSARAGSPAAARPPAAPSAAAGTAAGLPRVGASVASPAGINLDAGPGGGGVGALAAARRGTAASVGGASVASARSVGVGPGAGMALLMAAGPASRAAAAAAAFGRSPLSTAAALSVPQQRARGGGAAESSADPGHLSDSDMDDEDAEGDAEDDDEEAEGADHHRGTIV
jgi:hypothetical protein